VGWLDADHAFDRRTIPEDVLLRLRWLASERRVAQTRGFHVCPFCPAPPLDEDAYRTGSAEIWVPDGQHGYFAAPTLVVHYVAAHGYAPPHEFVKAIEHLEIGDRVPDLDGVRREMIRTASGNRSS
jgi:hypothetical protein